ncbi:hypothetical protein K439DRAFT_1638231 [Ramaria rubella]|nr:hypothetical protein K439DRAFT_1638231 [Ramaria rubella]
MGPSAEDAEDKGRFSESTRTRDPSLYASLDTLLEYERHHTPPASQPYISHQRAVKDSSKEDQRRLLRRSAPLSAHYRSLRLTYSRVMCPDTSRRCHKGTAQRVAGDWAAGS